VIKDEIQRAEKAIKFERFSGFFWCGVPQEICDRWERSENSRYQRVRGQDCQYPGVLIAAVVGIASSYDEVGRRWQIRLREFGSDGGREGEVLFDFLGKKRALETVESNNLAGEFCWMTRLIAE